MKPQFGDAITYQCTVSEVATFSRSNTLDDVCFATHILQFGQPSIEHNSANDGVHETLLYPRGYTLANGIITWVKA